MGGSDVAAWEQRWHPLREEWVVVAPIVRIVRGMGIVLWCPSARPPEYVETCYFCPCNLRVTGARNPDYQSVFVGDNDHPCVGMDAPRQLEPPPASIGIRRRPGGARGATPRNTTLRWPNCRPMRSPRCSMRGATNISNWARAPTSGTC